MHSQSQLVLGRMVGILVSLTPTTARCSGTFFGTAHFACCLVLSFFAFFSLSQCPFLSWGPLTRKGQPKCLCSWVNCWLKWEAKERSLPMHLSPLQLPAPFLSWLFLVLLLTVRGHTWAFPFTPGLLAPRWSQAGNFLICIRVCFRLHKHGLHYPKLPTEFSTTYEQQL